MKIPRAARLSAVGAAALMLIVVLLASLIPAPLEGTWVLRPGPTDVRCGEGATGALVRFQDGNIQVHILHSKQLVLADQTKVVEFDKDEVIMKRPLWAGTYKQTARRTYETDPSNTPLFRRDSATTIRSGWFRAQALTSHGINTLTRSLRLSLNRKLRQFTKELGAQQDESTVSADTAAER